MGERKIWAYGRVSDDDQNLERQLQEFRKYISDDRYILTDKQSGKNFNRPGYNALIGTKEVAPRLDKGDLLIILSIDRLGRNYTEIKEQWEYITKTLQVDIRVLDMPLLDTSIKSDDLDRKFIADLTLQILSYVAEKERVNIKKRQKQGIDVMPVVNGKKVSAKTKKPTGRPNATYPETWQTVYTQWKNGDITAKIAMTTLNMTRTTFYKLVKQFESK